MRIDPYLIVDGQCEAAFKFYQQCLGGTFWAARFGMCTDRFGVPCMINCAADKEGH